MLAASGLALAIPSRLAAQATPAVSEASATPAAVSLNRAPEAGTLTYSVGASEMLNWGFNGNSTASSTGVNGNAAFLSGSESHPTSFLYSGGYLWNNGYGINSGSYQNFGISQQYVTPKLGLVVGDTASYLPAAPVFSLSGLLGVGDIGTQPITTGVPSASLLTYFGRRVTNTVSGSATSNLTPSTAVTAYGGYTIQRFLDDTGIENNELDAGASLNHRIDARNSVGAGYGYTRFTYLPNVGLGFTQPNLRIDTQQFSGRFQHVFSRRMTLNVAAGPERTESSDPVLIPSRTDLFTSASLSYLDKRTIYLLSYSRGASNGGGVLLGTLSDNANFTATHDFTENWNGSFTLNYGHLSSLVVANLGHTVATNFYGGVQATRHLGRYWSAYGSYNLEHQDFSGPFVAYNGFSGNYNVLGFGVMYTPRPHHLHHH